MSDKMSIDTNTNYKINVIQEGTGGDENVVTMAGDDTVSVVMRQYLNPVKFI